MQKNKKTLLCQYYEVTDIESFLAIADLPDLDYKVSIINDIDFKPYQYVKKGKEEMYEKVQIVFKPIDLSKRTSPLIIEGRNNAIKNIAFKENEEISLFKNVNCKLIVKNLNFKDVIFLNNEKDTTDIVKIRGLKISEE